MVEITTNVCFCVPTEHTVACLLEPIFFQIAIYLQNQLIGMIVRLLCTRNDPIYRLSVFYFSARTIQFHVRGEGRSYGK